MDVADTPTDATSPDPEGGSGGSPDRADLADLKLFRRALAQGWDVPPGVKAKAVRRMAEILDNDEAGDRSHTAAAKTLVSMGTATTAAIQAAVAVHQATELAARLDELESRIVDGQHPGVGGEADEQPEDAP
jgi:hypothetical protein